jgi:hypothetical protein
MNTIGAPRLRELQRWMAARIACPDSPEPASHDDVLALPASCNAAERLNVYVNGYPARLREAFTETFPAVAHVIGQAAFATLARDYVQAHPPLSYNLNDAGDLLPEFVKQHPLTKRFPFLPDLALLEWRAAKALHARDLPAFDPAASCTSWTLEDWEEAVLSFQPSVALIESQWPVREIWEVREKPIEEIDIDLNDRPDHVLVWRHGLEVHCESLDRPEAAALRALLDGRTLGETVNRLATDGLGPDQVFVWSNRWVGLGIIAGCAKRA